MLLKVNGKELDTQATSLQELMDELGFKPEGVAAEVNMVIIKKADYTSFALLESDTVEIVRFVGGG